MTDKTYYACWKDPVTGEVGLVNGGSGPGDETGADYAEVDEVLGYYRADGDGLKYFVGNKDCTPAVPTVEEVEFVINLDRNHMNKKPSWEGQPPYTPMGLDLYQIRMIRQFMLGIAQELALAEQHVKQLQDAISGALSVDLYDNEDGCAGDEITAILNMAINPGLWDSKEQFIKAVQDQREAEDAMEDECCDDCGEFWEEYDWDDSDDDDSDDWLYDDDDISFDDDEEQLPEEPDDGRDFDEPYMTENNPNYFRNPDSGVDSQGYDSEHTEPGYED